MDNRLAIDGSVAALVAVMLVIALVVRRMLVRRARRRMADLLAAYFAGELPLDQLARRAANSVGPGFIGSGECQAVVQAAFQRAAEQRAVPSDPLQVEKALFGALAAVKAQLGIPDRYQSEGWRPGRE